MSWFSDNFDFELFNLKDMWSKIEDNPESLLLGAATPVGTSLWSGITGKDYEPAVNIFGGPMGGDWAGIGSGGVYDRAQDAGIDTGAAMGMHDIAETVAAFYGGQGALNGLQNAWGSMGGMEGLMPQGGESGGGFGDFGNMDWSNPQTYMDMMGQMPQGGMPGQRTQEPAPRPPPQFGGASNFMPMAPQMPPVMSPPRMHPFGLLEDEDEQQKMKALIGGLL